MKQDDRPYTVVWYNYTQTLEQCRKYIECLPDRIGNQDWKIIIHDHASNVEKCNANCDIIQKPGSRKWTLARDIYATY